MDWYQAHKLSALILFSGSLLVVGAIVVTSRSAVSPRTSTETWGSGVTLDEIPSPELPHQNPPASPSLSGADYSYIAPLAERTRPNAPVETTAPDEWSTIEAALSPKRSTSHTSVTSDSDSLDVYAFMPSGILTPLTPQKRKTPAEEELYAFGNEAGEAIVRYESEHPNQPQVLTDHMQDKNNPSKIAAMKKLGKDLVVVGDTIEAIDPTPIGLKNISAQLVASYREIGTKLAAIPDANGDDNLVNAILVYNESADRFAKAYIALVLAFQANGIRFSQEEAGSVFMMPAL